MTDPTILKFGAIAYHRNGVGGHGFHVVLFRASTDGKERNMVAVCFDERPECTAVLDVDLVAAGNVAMGENSWRGDVWADELAPLLKAHEEA